MKDKDEKEKKENKDKKGFKAEFVPVLN